MLKFFIGGIVFLLLLGAGYGITTTQATRYIPWDCADWQAFAHDDRTTAILESLAENRGKTLYCGIDQSDTFTKAETWEAGKDRNERDDTVYFGERGSFRGFIAAQEGWLTEGESGVTGLSRHHIFEFPREPKKRRRWKTIKLPVPADDSRKLTSIWVTPSSGHTNLNTRQSLARTYYGANIGNADVPFVNWQARAEAHAENYCDEQGYHRAVDVVLVEDSSTRWEYRDNTGHTPTRSDIRLIRTYSATCEKRVRR